IYCYSYRIALLKDLSKLYFVCYHCYKHKYIDTSVRIYETTLLTSLAQRHLELPKRGHGYSKRSSRARAAPPYLIITSGVSVSQEVSNSLRNFNQQRFRLAIVGWLAENNHLLREVETPSFQNLLRAANLEAELATFRSHTSVAAFLLRLYANLQPQVQSKLSCALSKVHISFNG
ncbi:hypothetical protein CC80DRAFT_398820, partial [Byssothecium circinans]